MPARGSSKASQDVQQVPTPGEWVQQAPGHYVWREGTARDLHEEHEPNAIHRLATGYTSEHGVWEFTGVPAMPEGGVEGSTETVDDIDRQMAALAARKARLQASGE